MNEETCEDKNVLPKYKSWKFKDVQAEHKRLSLPYAVAAMNINGDLNVGVMLRTATMFSAERFFILGKRQWDRRSSVGSHNYIDVVVHPADTENGVIPRDQLNELMTAYGYFPVFVELGGTDLLDIKYNASNPKGCIDRFGELKYQGRNPCIILGNEHYGISKEYIGSDPCVSIDQGGVMRSLNVSAAAAIVIHHFYRLYKDA